jgi:hypothetical protein
MSAEHKSEATEILKRNLQTHRDWIVLNNSMQTLGEWAEEDDELKAWLLPHLERLQSDQRKSVAGRARKLISLLS